jgi:hypothetical protein
VQDWPGVVALAVEGRASGETVVTVPPVTHRQPDNAAAGVEISLVLKRHLGLDDAESRVVVRLTINSCSLGTIYAKCRAPTGTIAASYRHVFSGKLSKRSEHGIVFTKRG